MLQQTFKELLKQLNACKEAIDWAADMTIEQVVKECHRGDWFLWLAYKINIDKRKLTLAKGHCANTVRHLMKDERSLKAVDAAVDYGNGLIDDEQLKTAAADAPAYADASAAAAYAAASAATATASAASAAAAYAAAIATATAASAAAEKQNQMQTANICREHIGDLIIDKLNEILNK